MIITSGSAGLLGRRLDPPDPVLRDVVRHQALEAARLNRALAETVAKLNAVGIEPFVIKGWTIARQYPGSGLRPYCDLDLVVGPEEHERAFAITKYAGVPVDLHRDLAKLCGRPAADVRARSLPLPVEGGRARELCVEDHLRLLASHFFTHGGWRTVWLCDIALLGERPDLDVAHLTSGQARYTEQVLLAFGLAAELLGAAPPTSRPVPRWLRAAVLAQWGDGFVPHAALERMPRNPIELVREARRRWPNPIQATAALEAPFDRVPRFPIQLVDYFVRTGRFLFGSIRAS